METKEIIDRTRIIAEFKGFNGENDIFLVPEMEQLKYKAISIGGNNLEYHMNWNLLMTVVETIESFHSLEDHKYINVIISQGYIEIQGVPSNRIFKNTSIEGGKINALYLAVIDFIKVYNEMFPVYE